LGNAIGQLLPALLVPDTAGSTLEDQEGGIYQLLWVEFGLCVFSMVWVALCFKSVPAVLPSRTTQHHVKVESKLYYRRGKSLKKWIKRVWKKLRSQNILLLKNKHFLFLLCGFGIGMAIFNAFMSLIGEVVAVKGFGEDDAGFFGTTLILVGLGGAVLFGLVLDQKHCYREALRLGYGSAIIVLWALFFCLDRKLKALVYICFGALGFFMIPMMPATMESAAECTYPVSEDDAVGLLMTTGNVLGVVLTIALDYFLKQGDPNATGVSYIFGAQNIFVGICSVAAFLSIMCFNGEYRRLAKDNKEQSVDHK